MKSSDHFIKLDKSHPKLINTNDNSKTNDTGNYGFDPNNLITKKVDDDQSNQRSQSLLKQESLSIQEPAEKYREHRRRFKSLYQLQKRKSIENELLRSISNYQSYPKEKIDPSDVNSASVTPSNSGAQLNFQNLQIMHQRVKSGTIFKQNVHQNNKSQISLGSIQRKSTIVFHDEENYQKVVSFPQSLKNSEIQRNSSCESPNKNQQEVIGNYNQDEKINTFQNVQPFSGQFDMKQLSIDLKQLKHIQNQQDYQIHSQGGVDGFYYGNQFVDQILEEDDDEGKPEVHIVDPLNITHDSGESSPDGMKHLEFINVQENESQNHEQLVSFVNYEDTQDENKARDSYQIEVHQPKIDYYQNNSIENLQQYAQERYFTKQFNQEFSQVNINNKVKKVPFLTQLATERIGQKPPMFQSKSYKLKSNRVKPISNNNFKSNHSGLDSAQSRERSYFLVQQQLQNAKIISKENEKSQNYITPQGECTDYLILLSNFLRNSYQRKSFQIKAFLSYSNDANQTISQSHDIFNKNHNKILVIKLWNIIKEDKQILERVDLIEKILFIIQQKLNQQIINTKIYIEDVLDYIYSDQKQILNSQKNGSKFYHKYLNRDQLPSVQTICKICNKNTDFKDIENFKAFNDKNSSQQIQVSNINGRLLISNKKMIDLQEDLLHCQSLQQNQQKLQLQQQAYNNLLNMQITPEYLNENVKQESIERNLMMSSRPDIVDEEAISKCTFGPQNTDQDDDQRGSVQIKNYKTQQMTSQILNLKNKIPENSKVVRREISLYSGGASRSGDIFSVRSPQFLLNSQFGVNTQNFNAQRNNNHNTIHLHESSASASLIESAIITNRSQLIFKSGQNLKSAGSRDFYLRNYLNSNQIPLKNEVLKSQSNMIHSIVFDENEVCEICGETIEKHDLDINFELHYQIEQYQEMLVNTTYNQNSTLIQNAMTRHSKKHSLIKQDDDKNQIKFQINNETGAGLLRTKTPVDIEQQEQIDFIGQNDNIQKEDGPSIKQLSKAKETLTQKLYNKLFQSSGAGNENTLISQAHTLKNNQENRLSSLEFQTCYGLNNFKSVVQFSKNRSFIQNQQSQRQIGTLQSILKKKNNGPGHFKQMSVGEQEGLQHRLDLARFNIMNGLGIISKQNSAVQVFQPTELQNKNMKFIQSKFIDSTQNIPEETHVICIICAEQFEKSLWKQIKMKCENQSVKHLICSNCNIHCIEEQIKQFRKELILQEYIYKARFVMIADRLNAIYVDLKIIHIQPVIKQQLIKITKKICQFKQKVDKIYLYVSNSWHFIMVDIWYSSQSNYLHQSQYLKMQNLQQQILDS
ncbi:UNKNOWN [Stylonychia lemnae]|uniref:Uncharacterized protein n=1 Tax=Stylonychia lemnae TaxID=5949 RepID=A0A077ZS81_STYLE|nr:UNKNOWN [Stylonychia lemnae]|eukprot:CDW72230.1 UNKNOWN [Stylonychia lemnae]